MEIKIHSELIIPSNEIKWRFSRSSGAGGQNVNKNDTRVEIIFDIERSKSLNPRQKYRLKEKLKNKLANNCIRIAIQDKRTQYQNRAMALIRLGELIRENITPPPKPRRITKPTKASQTRRIESKKKRSQVKQSRRKL
tara:strand:+ start:276 stop:689 length:414 start_codon:yes stop_codon:yes gene_type:complete